MAKTKPGPALTADDGANALSVRFYVSDGASGNVPRCEYRFVDTTGELVAQGDRPASDFSALTNPQKVQLRNFILAIRDQAFTLDGWT